MLSEHDGVWYSGRAGSESVAPYLHLFHYVIVKREMLELFVCSVPLVLAAFILSHLLHRHAACESRLLFRSTYGGLSVLIFCIARLSTILLEGSRLRQLECFRSQNSDAPCALHCGGRDGCGWRR